MHYDTVIVVVDNGGQWVVLDGDTPLPKSEFDLMAMYMILADEVSEVTTQGPALFVRGQAIPPYFIDRWIEGLT